jgi:2-haloacid dehalogenase
MVARSVAVFDLGGVLVDWNPRYLYRKLFNGDEAGMEHFLSAICTQDWNERQDAGRSFAEATAELAGTHPDKLELIEAWGRRFDEMMAGPIAGTLEILAELRARGVPLYALSNWSAETFPHAERRFDWLQWFRGIVVSGHEKVIKPDPRMWEILMARYGLAAAELVYIDDNARNAATAAGLGLHGIHFTDPPALRRELEALGFLSPF